MLYEIAELDAAALRHVKFYQAKLKTLQTEYEDKPQKTIQQLRKSLLQIQQAHTWINDKVDVDTSYADLLTDMTASSVGHLRMVITPDEWQHWLEQGIDAATACNRPVDILDFRIEQGIQKFRQGNLETAEALVESTLQLAHQQDIPSQLAQLYYLRALIYQKQGKTDHAMQAVKQAQHYYEIAEDIYGIGKVRSFMAQSAIDALDYDSARTLLEQNITLWKQYDNQRQLAVEQYQLGLMLSNQLLFDDAEHYLLAAREIFQQLSDRRYEAYTLQILSSNQTEIGDYGKALITIQQASDLFEQVDDRRGMTGCLNYMGRIYELNDEFDKALDYHKQAIDLAKSINYHFHHADAHRAMCLIYLKLDDVQSAGAQLYSALHVAQTSGNQLMILAVLCAAVGVLTIDNRPSLAAGLAQAIQQATEEPLILQLLEPHLNFKSSESADPIPIDDAPELIKNLYQ